MRKDKTQVLKLVNKSCDLPNDYYELIDVWMVDRFAFKRKIKRLHFCTPERIGYMRHSVFHRDMHFFSITSGRQIHIYQPESDNWLVRMIQNWWNGSYRIKYVVRYLAEIND